MLPNCINIKTKKNLSTIKKHINKSLLLRCRRRWWSRSTHSLYCLLDVILHSLLESLLKSLRLLSKGMLQPIIVLILHSLLLLTVPLLTLCLLPAMLPSLLLQSRLHHSLKLGLSSSR